MSQLLRQSLAGLKVLIAFTIVLGLAYPLLITGIGKVVAPGQADGSPITVQDKVVGSSLIGQPFGGKQWFWSRPSLAGDGYDSMSSGGSNLAANSPQLATTIQLRRAQIAKANRVRPDQVPPDAVTASGSGLDPDISPAYAAIQVGRVAAARGLSPAQVRELVAEHTQGRTLGFLGEPRVNVLELNAALAAVGGR
ncbi:potassium-transporting ATPase subunit KdpC [Microlunatus elymi]|uniref:Potassium-transporting ATPase KdpC subunit n=1 Tax=Microlunatus elymi TaxID=2596828 RepID=A0A516Q2F7_9ACTN|nr:potassium-transporting ATPase subunit KdpC [Microlunatus elymi]QDP97391.1 potassium-transporting ATPase subunit KdpC [Microlunatus elymi]